jgi:hypothetical protein
MSTYHPRAFRRLFFLLAVVAAGWILTACFSYTAAPRRSFVGYCQPDQRLAGTWKSYRSSQLGPSWVTLTFACDCTFDTRIRLPWMWVREQGFYRVGGGSIHFDRKGETTAWPFGFEGASLRLEEAPGEFHVYQRVSEQACWASGVRP